MEKPTSTSTTDGNGKSTALPVIATRCSLGYEYIRCGTYQENSCPEAKQTPMSNCPIYQMAHGD